jgi:hypothetical protein
MDDTWWSRDLPVLDVVVRLRENHDFPDVVDIARETGFDAEDVARALADMDGRYVDLQKTMGDVDRWFVKAVTPEARRAVGHRQRIFRCDCPGYQERWLHERPARWMRQRRARSTWKGCRQFHGA